ncbi:hypothetical protein Tco_1549544 [Tanacetum coccineum]
MLNKTIVSQTEIFVNKPFWSQNFVNSSYPTPSSRPTKVEIPKELPKVSMVNTSLKKLKHHLAGFHVVIKERTTTTTITMLESEAYKTYHNYVAGEKILKPKYVKNKADLESSPKKKFVKASKGKRIKTSTKVTKPVKKKQPATTSKEKGLNVLSEVALSEAEQIKMATKRSLIQTHGSYASGSGKSSDEDDDDEVSLSNDDDNNADNEDDDGQDDDNEQTESDNDGDDFVHPKFSTHDEEERQDDKDKEEEGLDMRVQTPSHYEPTDDETYDEVTQRDNVEEGRDTKMTDALLANVQTTQVIEDTHVIITAATPEVQHHSSSVSLGFISNMLNPVSLIPSIVDTYLANKINEVVKTAVQLQSDRLRDEAQAENEDFINTLDENIKKINKEQVKVQVKEKVSNILPRIKKSKNEQLEAAVMIRSSNEAKTSHAVAAYLSELKLKKILIDKMENNKSIDRSVQQTTLYNALVNAYETEKDILATYGDTVMFKRRRDDEDEDEEPSAGSNRGSKRRRARKEPESTSTPKEKTSKSTGMSKEGSKSHQKSTGKSAQAEESIHADEDLEEPAHQEYDSGFTEDQPVDQTTQHLDCTLAQNEDPRESFNELMDTPLDFSAFVMNRLKVDTLTLELLVGPTYELIKGWCKSLVELEEMKILWNLNTSLKKSAMATTDQLDWNNPEGRQYPHDLRKPLPLIPNLRGHRVMTNMHSEASLTRGKNVNNSMDLQ